MQYFCQTYFLTKTQQKYIWSTEIYFYVFFQTVWFLTGIPLILYIFPKSHIIYRYCYELLMLLFRRISHDAIISHHLKIQSLGLIWLSECLQSKVLILQNIFVLSGPFLESKDISEIFQKKSKNGAEYLQIWAKMYKI